ncbi:MAG TPA: hypothetical protein GX707_06260 [Epulopiscium sp.]|nr:hypothetical protein [Candidatus Epulonipiscium sp.]
MSEKKIVFYCFNGSAKDIQQESQVVDCELGRAHELFNKEYARQKEGRSKWSYFDITVNGKLLRSSRN